MLRDHFRSLWNKLRRRNQISRAVSLCDSSVPPWGVWDLDPKFFQALSRWTRDHPESSLDRVLSRICAGIDNGETFMQLIPDSPFPARGLLGALAHLVKLGATISTATRDVRKFAEEIVRWVGAMKSAFEGRKGGHVTLETLKNLAEMRALIDEVCKWATARLEDGRWSRVGHALLIGKEIDDFKSRITNARAIFMDLTMINLSRGQDDIIQSVRDLIASIQQTQKEQLSLILDEMEAQKQAEARRQFLAQILSKRAVSNTAYDDQGKRPCDEDTRIDVLADIKDWIFDVSDTAQPFLWLTGDPGSGKSAVTASVARECKDNGILWAQFFINRNLGDTTNPASYFPSIARQLADHSPDVALAIHDILKEQPSLMDDISQQQAGKLFVQSLKVASSIDPSTPVVIIIDGLDETDTTRLRYTAEIFSQALVDLSRNTKVFISSRTEDDIRKPFSATFHVKHVKHIHLDTSSESSIRDVSTYLVRNIADIVERNDLDISKWPGEERMETLCNQASGLFIWAVTVTKFIEEEVASSGRECLNDVFDQLNINGMDDINVLYGTILQLTHKREKDPWGFERFRQIVGCIIALKTPLCLADISCLLDLRNPTTNTAVDIEHHVRRLRTVLVAHTHAVDGQTVPRLHKSFFEFITSERADSQFRIHTDKSHGVVAMQCLRQLAGLKKICVQEASEGHLSSTLRYACEFWTSHLPSGTTAGVAIAGPSDYSEFQELCRRPSGGKQPSSANITLSADKKQIVSSSRDTICLWDSGNGARIKLPVKGHILYSVAFSPDGTQIISGSSDGTLRLWDARSGQPIGSPLTGHTSNVYSVAFSPDSKYIISGSSDNTLRLWDTHSGQPVGSPFSGHTNSVYCVAFSPDGDRVISGSSDGTLRLWDLDTSGTRSVTSVEFPTKLGHIGAVNSVAFSPDGKQIVSGSSDGTLRLWEVQSARDVGPPFKRCTEAVYSVAFSPNRSQIISGSSDGTLRLWNAQDGEPIGAPFQGHTDFVHSVAFSPDGNQIISGSWDCTVRLWDARGGQAIRSFKGHTEPVHCVAFSPDGTQVISSSSDATLRFWDVLSGQPIEFSFEGHLHRVTCIAISPDSKTIVSTSLDDEFRAWDARTGLPFESAFERGARRVVSVTFSPNGDQFATSSSDGNICLWDTASRSLLTSYHTEHANMATCITFSTDGKQLISCRGDGYMEAWNVTNNQPDVSSHSYTSLLNVDKPFCFSMGRGWCREHDDHDGTLLQWFLMDNQYFGQWAYIDGKVIRKDKNGSTTVVDMTNVLLDGGSSGNEWFRLSDAVDPDGY